VSRSSARRGQTEPLAALVTVLVVVTAVGIHAGVVSSVAPGDTERSPAEPAVHRSAESLRVDGVVRPALLSETTCAPDDYRCNVTVVGSDRVWTTGPRPPRNASAARLPVPVRAGRHVVAGAVRVEVWP
jgi:flagellin-like protein